MTTIILLALVALFITGLVWFVRAVHRFIRDGRCMYMHFVGAIGPK